MEMQESESEQGRHMPHASRLVFQIPSIISRPQISAMLERVTAIVTTTWEYHQ